MTSDLQRPHRRSIRLPGYDYALSGAYFVTVVVQQRACLLGTIENNVMHLSPAGEMVRAAWESLPARFPHVAPDAFVVMPNHVHGVIFMMDDIWDHGSEPRAPGPDVGAPLVGAQGVDAGDASIERRQHEGCPRARRWRCRRGMEITDDGRLHHRRQTGRMGALLAAVAATIRAHCTRRRRPGFDSALHPRQSTKLGARRHIHSRNRLCTRLLRHRRADRP